MLERKSPRSSTARYRPGLHVHVYFWVALVAISITLPLFISSAFSDADLVPQGVSAFLIVAITFQALLWRARRRCSTEALGVWDGWLYITGSMTIGVGGTSFLIAVPSTAIAVIATAGIAFLDLFETQPTTAQHRFHRMVSWFIRHRMHQ